MFLVPCTAINSGKRRPVGAVPGVCWILLGTKYVFAEDSSRMVNALYLLVCCVCHLYILPEDYVVHAT